VSQHFCFRPLCHPNAFGKHSSIARESLGDIARTRADRVVQLVGTFVLPPEIGREQEQIDAEIELMRELPRRQVANIVAAIHAGAWCKRTATDILANSGGFQPRRFKATQNLTLVRFASIANSASMAS
jgi:hypothetical protein